MGVGNIIGIMASDPNGVIGKGKDLPWHFPDEFEHFQKTTFGHVVVMGRKTFETMPLSLLRNRTPVIFSHQVKPSFHAEIECIFVTSLEDFLTRKSQWDNKKIFMIGGAEIAHLFLKNGLISEFILTRIDQPFEGDVHLNLKLLDGWPQTILKQTPNYTICCLKNPKN